MQWQMGKTAATIRFVKEAEAYFASLPQAKFAFDTELEMTEKHHALSLCVVLLKSGLFVFHDWVTIEHFFATLPDSLI